MPESGSDGTDGQLFRLATELSESGHRYALATVISRQAPSSSRVGQKALIEEDGTVHGWLGGSCVEPVVRREALEALGDGQPRLIVLAPDRRSDRPDAIVYPMTCHSGGTVEIYLEPQLPASLLLVYGDSPVTRSLAALGEQAGYRVRVLAEPDALDPLEPDLGDRAAVCAVVATHGEWDAPAVEHALRAGARYVGLVASPRRAREERSRLLARDWDEAELAPLVAPAGLDIGALRPPEIAISILAELIQRRAERKSDRAGEAEPTLSVEPAVSANPAVGVDPVCGMEVRIEGARHTLKHDGTTYFFCCSGCREKFARDLALAVES